MKKNKEKKSVFDTIINIFAWLSFALAILMALTAIFATFSDEQNGKEMLGTKMLIVASDSMSKSPLSEDEEIFFETGDIILIKTVEEGQEFKEGDVITFISYDKDSYGKTITHKIREVKFNAQGKLIGYVTYGINTGVNDKTLVQPDSIIGYYAGKIPNLGNIFAFLKTPRGYFMSILTPCVLLIIFFSMKVGKAVGQKKVLVEYDEELDTLKKRVDELEKQIQEYQTKDTETQATETVKEETISENETPPIVVPITETTEVNTVTDYSAVNETSDSINKLEINGTKTPFYKKVLALSEEVQEYFNRLHNEIISYKKVKARLSFKCMSYRIGRKLLAKISVRGKTLTMHFALDVNAFDYNVYYQKDMGDKKAYKDVPFTVKVKSDRGLKNAIKLINELGVINSLNKNEKFVPVNAIKLLNPLDSEIAIADFNEDDKLLIINAKKVSFSKKLERLTEEVKAYYAEIREEFASYKKVSERLSLKCMSYRTGRKLLAKISVRGKTLTMHFALDVNEFNKNVYFQKDMSDKKAYKDVPFTVKVKSNRAKRNALKLIKDLMEKNQVIKINK